MRYALLSLLLLVGNAQLIARSHSRQLEHTTRPPAATRYWPVGIDLGARDPSVSPGNDFWRYANNHWFQDNPIPPDQSIWGVSAALGVDLEAELRQIVADAAQGTDPTSRRVAGMYASWMDETGLEARGTGPLHHYLARVDAVRNRDDLIRLFADPAYPSPLSLSFNPSTADPTQYLATFAQGGLGMPSRDYYLNEGAQFETYRAAYRTYVATMLRLAGYPDPEARADNIIALEHRIAEAQWAPERTRDLAQSINLMTPAQLQGLAPDFNWPLMLSSQGLGNVQTIIVRQTTAIQAEARLLEDVSLQTWKDWEAFSFIDNYGRFLPSAFDQAAFEFYSHTLRGTQRPRDRWRRGLAILDQSLGEAVGRLYVQRYFPADSRHRVTELVADLRAALGERLRANGWMDEATRTAAIAKLDTFEPRIGGPDHWIDYSSLRIDPRDLLGNAVRAAEFQRNLELSRLPYPVDRRLWDILPQAINAYYDPQTNQITFPAAILQPPYFNPHADAAVNYGAIGAVIGHEMSHGFDDQGRRFDPVGRLHNWWSTDSDARFHQLTERLAAQYDAFEAAGQHLNGHRTMGENIGDLGGLEMAYAAYQRYQGRHGRAPVIGGLTGDQRFFLAYAQIWRNSRRDDALRRTVLTDPHSPDEFRVNGVVRNMDAWYRAFNIRPNERLYLAPEQRVHIWW